MKRSQLYFGRNVLKEAIASRATITTIYVETRSAYEFVQTIPGLAEKNIPFEEGVPPQLKNEAHQGIAFRCHHQFYTEYNPEILKNFSFIVLCNHLEDVHNLGSIARCAAAFGARLIIHEETKSASMTPSAVKSSAGTAFRLKFMKVPHLKTVFSSLKKRGYTLTGLDLSSESVSLYDWTPQLPQALVLGSEGAGIEPELKALCDTLLKIPMDINVDSLNVSHAAALAMNRVRQCRKSTSPQN